MQFLEQYWPIMALTIWFGYKWWAAKQVVRKLPELRQNGAREKYYQHCITPENKWLANTTC